MPVAKMATAGIEVRRSNPSVATVWVAELLAAANRQADELENRKTHESIRQMFGKITSNTSNPKLSFEEILCKKITKQKKKNAEKEKEYQMTVKSKKKKKELTNGVSKTEYISNKQKTSMPGSEKKTTPCVESIKSRLDDQSISRSARKKLKRKLKELQSKRETTEQKATSVQDRKKFKLLKNKTEASSSVQKKKLSLTNGHQPDISTTLTNGHQECQASTITNGFKMTNTTIHVSTKHKETQPDEDDLQPPSKKSKLAKTIDKLGELLKKKKKKRRSKQKNIKKDKRPDHMKPPHLQMKTDN